MGQKSPDPDPIKVAVAIFAWLMILAMIATALFDKGYTGI